MELTGNCSSKPIHVNEGQEREVTGETEINTTFENNEDINTAFEVFEAVDNAIQNCEMFISKSSNGTDYICSLCNYIIEHSASGKKFRFSLWSHINEETHRVKLQNITDDNNKTDKRKQAEEQRKLASVQLKTALASFELSKQEKKTSSKQFFIRKSEGKAYNCKLCDVEVLYSSNNNEFRFNLLLHINDKGHRFRLNTAHTNTNDKSKKTRGKHDLEKKTAKKKCEVKEAEGLNYLEEKDQVGRRILEELGNITQAYEDRFQSANSHRDSTATDTDGVQPSNSKARIKKQFIKRNSCGKREGSKMGEKKDEVKNVNNNTNGAMKATEEDIVEHSEELKNVFDSFEQSNPVTETSKEFILKTSNSKDYLCTLCNVQILYPLNDNEFRFNLWSHINGESHRENLPNYGNIVKSFEKEKNKISKALPAAYKNDADFFAIGPMFRFAKCNLCNVAVSLNFYRLTNHIQGEEHTSNRRSAMHEQEVNNIESQVRSRREYAKLKSKIDGKFTKDMKLIQPGEMPGYVVCIACCHVVLATKFYLEKHFTNQCHVKGRCLRLVNKSNMNLDDVMQNIPDDLKGFKSIFVEDKCGVRCCRCQEVIPATTQDLYAHIIKER